MSEDALTSCTQIGKRRNTNDTPQQDNDIVFIAPRSPVFLSSCDSGGGGNSGGSGTTGDTGSTADGSGTADGDDGTATGPGNIIVTIENPSFDGLYGRSDPEIVYTVTEGSANSAVADARLAAAVFDQVGGALQNERGVENLHSGVRTPPLEDGPHMLVFVVRDEDGNPQVTLEIPFGTDTGVPSIALSSPVDGSVSNVAAPLLEYAASDEATVSVTLDEQLIDTVSGQALPARSDGAHILQVTARDSAGNFSSALAVYTVDSRP